MESVIGLLVLIRESLSHSTVLTICTVAVSTLIAKGIYNRYCHPLRDFPGPFWASVSDFWKLYICLTKDSHTISIELHKKYGPVLRVAPNLLAFNDPELLPKVYHRFVDKTDFYSTGILGEPAPPFQAQPHAEHAAKRKRIASLFSMSNLRKLQGEVDEAIVQFESILRERFAKQGEKLDFAKWTKLTDPSSSIVTRWFIYDTVSHMAFGEAIGFVRNGCDVGGLIQAFHDMAPMGGLVAALPWLMNPILKNPVLGKFLMPKAGDRSGTGKIMMYRDKMLEDRLKNRHSNSHGDFLDNLFAATNSDGTLMSIDEIKTESFVLMTAAADTSAAFIGPFVNHVIQDRRVYKMLVQEIRSFQLAGKLSSPVATFNETNEMPYFIACVKETLRFSPSTPFILPRLVSRGGMEVNGIWVPEGTEIGGNPYVIHRDSAKFGADADLFRPERWLENEKAAKEMDKYIFSWGYGTRTCLGKNIAQMIFQKLCLHLFRVFRFQSVNPKKPWRSENLGIMLYWDQWLTIGEVLHESEPEAAMLG